VLPEGRRLFDDVTLTFGPGRHGLVGDDSSGKSVLLRLAGLMLDAPDVLVLDEPTNDLDVAARARLTRIVDEFSTLACRPGQPAAGDTRAPVAGARRAQQQPRPGERQPSHRGPRPNDRARSKTSTG
jgi:ABC-type transport system involved in cytochrome c biogenesis ATPase subunit